ncbi:hypothetical protein HK096_006771 [Nowakowskiella sp. JEL0078]|nr:hypothetical protein HK096_006771 [Nowakowskiella sp. JEL0078]
MTQQSPDVYIVRGLRNYLFKGAPIDLFANDIQRARDVGLPSYVNVRRIFDLPVPDSFDKITSNATISLTFQSTYKNISLVDPTIGGLAEDRDATSNVGPLFSKSIIAQLTATRDGDRFWFENPGIYPPDLVKKIRETTMRDLIQLHCELEFGRPVPEGLIGPDVWHSKNNASISQNIPDGFKPILNKNNQYFLLSKLSNNSVTIEIQCFSTGGWCGFGFGDSMANADIVIVRPSVSGTVTRVIVQEYKSLGYQTKPVLRTAPASIFVVSQGYENQKLKVRFTRTLKLGDGFNNLEASSQSIILAYASFITKLPVEGADWFVQHSLYKYKATVDFFNGKSCGNGDWYDWENVSSWNTDADCVCVFWLRLF